MIEEIDKLSENMPEDGTFRASLSIINIECHPGFNCVVPDSCTVNIDYRFTVNETVDSILARFREIAEKLNLPLGTVKSRIFFTRQKLQEELKDFR